MERALCCCPGLLAVPLAARRRLSDDPIGRCARAATPPRAALDITPHRRPRSSKGSAYRSSSQLRRAGNTICAEVRPARADGYTYLRVQHRVARVAPRSTKSSIHPSAISHRSAWSPAIQRAHGFLPRFPRDDPHSSRCESASGKPLGSAGVEVTRFQWSC